MAEINDDKDHCPHCHALLYVDRDEPATVPPRTKSAIAVEVRSVYAGTLYFVCPHCCGIWHRWPEGHRLRVHAEEHGAWFSREMRRGKVRGL